MISFPRVNFIFFKKKKIIFCQTSQQTFKKYFKVNYLKDMFIVRRCLQIRQNTPKQPRQLRSIHMQKRTTLKNSFRED